MKTRILKKTVYSMLLAALAATSAFSAEAPPTMTSEATTKSLWDTIKEHSSATYFGVLHGPALDHMNSGNQPDATGNLDPTAPLNFESTIFAQYDITKKVAVGVAPHF